MNHLHKEQPRKSYSVALSIAVLLLQSSSCFLLLPTTTHAFLPAHPGGTMRASSVIFSPTSIISQNGLLLTTPKSFSTHLLATSSSSSDEATVAGSEINWNVLGQSALNQALLGATIWTGGPQYQTLVSHLDVTASSSSCSTLGLTVLLGVAGFIPLVVVSRAIETSDSYWVSGLNLSTNQAVLRFFGSTTKPIRALLISVALSSLTAVAEETTFRGQLIPALQNSEWGHGNVWVGATLSTLVFAILHTNPTGFFKGKESFVDNSVLLALQTFNGGIFALLYLGAGENLAVPILAHALYDTYTFYKTHMVDVAGQMDYARSQSNKNNNNNSSPTETRWITQKGPDFVQQAKQAFYLMDTNKDGVVSPRELRISLYSYGINLSPQQLESLTAKADADGSGAVDLDEYLDFLGPTGSTTKAVRYTLFGPI